MITAIAFIVLIALSAFLGVLAMKIGENQSDIWFGPPEDPGKAIRDRQRGIKEEP